jgi:hypothetical protein
MRLRNPFEEMCRNLQSTSVVAVNEYFLPRSTAVAPMIQDMIKFHKPHPESIMKRCYLREIAKQLKDKGIIK